MPLGSVSVCITHIFLSNHMGQIVTEHNNDVFTTA